MAAVNGVKKGPSAEKAVSPKKAPPKRKAAVSAEAESPEPQVKKGRGRPKKNP